MYRSFSSADVISSGGRRIDSAMASAAQFQGLCAPADQHGFVISSAVTLITSSNNLALLDKALIEIMLLSGCRVGSVLKIRPSDVSPTGIVRVPPEKGGLSVLVVPLLYRSFWSTYSACSYPISAERNRFYMYRLFKKYGIVISLSHLHNSSVTHSLRHSFLHSTANLQITERERANAAGHSSVLSQKYYLPR